MMSIRTIIVRINSVITSIFQHPHLSCAVVLLLYLIMVSAIHVCEGNDEIQIFRKILHRIYVYQNRCER